MHFTLSKYVTTEPYQPQLYTFYNCVKLFHKLEVSLFATEYYHSNSGDTLKLPTYDSSNDNKNTIIIISYHMSLFLALWTYTPEGN